MKRFFTNLTKLFCGLTFLLTGLKVNAQDTLRGVTQIGGAGQIGTLFSLKTDGSNYKVDYSLPAHTYPGAQPYGTPISYNGKLYGLTSSGGTEGINGGVIFEYDPTKGTYTELYDFQQADAFPIGSLIVYNNIFYGMTYGGGTNDAGMIFSFDPSKSGNAAFTDLFDFSEDSNGGYPRGDLTVYNNKLYGMTYVGGVNDAGVVFSFDPTKSGAAGITKLFDFDDSQNGGYPYGNLTVFNNKLYGMAYEGGTQGGGIIFSYDPTSTNASGFSRVFNFDGGANGGNPTGSLTVYNNKLYGMTSAGGTSGAGVIFGFDPSQTGSAAFTTLYNFDGATASGPRNNNLVVYNNLLYGMTYSKSVIFSYDPSKTGDAGFNLLYNFQGTDAYGSNGSFLIYNNLFYGFTSNSNSTQAGIMFTLDPSNSKFTTLFTFNSPPPDNGPLNLVSSNGIIYGTTRSSGSTPTLFKFNPANGQFAHLYSFDPTTTQATPGSLVTYHGLLYGLTADNTGSGGSVYSYNPVSNVFKTLFQFNKSVAGNPNGIVMDNGKIYVATSNGGSSGYGTIFSLDLTTLAYKKLYDFTSSLQINGTLIFNNNVLYGYGYGSLNYLVSFDLTSNTAKQLYSFVKQNGIVPNPTGDLLILNNKIYGSTSNDGINQIGTLYSYDLQTNTYAKVYDLSDATGTGAAHMVSDNNKVYGVLEGNNFNGAVFSFDPATANSLKVLHNFTGSGGDGATPKELIVYHTPKPQTITFKPVTKTYGDPDFKGAATSTNSTIPVTYRSLNTTIATISADSATIHIVGAGTAKIVAIQPGNDIYSPAKNDTVTLTVNKAPLAITANDVVIHYGDPIPTTFTATYATFVNNETNSVLGAPVTFATNATATSPVGVYAITPAGPTTNPNYAITYHAGKLTISDGTAIITYGSNFPTQLTYGAQPFDPGATSSAGTSPVYTTSDPKVATVTSDNKIQVTGAGTVTIIATFAAGNSFGAGSANKTLTIAPAPLTITAQDNQREYKAADPVFVATYSGLVNGDTQSSLTTAPQFTTTATNTSLPGVYTINICCAASPNYTFTYISGKLTVTGNQTVTFNPFSVMTYGDAPFDPGATANSGLTAVYTTSNPSVAVIDNGQVKITGAGTATITATFPTSGNYLTTNASQTLTVQPKQLTIQADNQSRAQGQPNPTLTVSYTGFVNGDTYLSLTQQPDITTSATTISAAGTYPITVSGAKAFNNNYTIDYANGTLTVLAARSITFNAPAAATYGDADFDAGITIATGETPQYSSSDPNVAVINNGKIHITGAGSTTLTVTLPAGNGYTSATSVSQLFTVNPAKLIVTADNTTRVYLQPNPPLTLSYQGFVLGEDASKLSSQPAAITTATSSSYPGTYLISVSGGTAQNYTFQYVTGTLTVAPQGGSNSNSMLAKVSSRSALDVSIYLTDQEPVNLLLYDVGGRLLNSQRPPLYKGFNTYTFDVSLLPTGVYIVKAVGDNLNMTQKILVH